ncbi:E3 ubiquitin-protein ligase TRIM71-like [Asterias rubens]|uniref:E3 ubiquitin-protein ligase TRIM71-like n=1 Tax=Asterias rubens TaxID=7604 RepID=UPI0014552C7B|nr:E3 ubiquitin-protein ligase TRIM71-like [Asterias rubens]
MATGGITVESVLGKISRDHLECAVCSDNFKNPKVLDCLHTFCLKCLREMRTRQDPKNKKLICPICRKETNLEKIEVDDLPHNFTLDALVDELYVHQKLLGNEPSRVTCQSCEEEDRTAVSRCMDCDHFLCQDCKQAHGRLAVTRSHTTYSLDQFRSGEIVYKSKLREHIPKCQKHLDQSLSIYCNTCEQMACTTCSVLNHGQHALVGIPEAYDSFKQQVADLVSKVKNKIKELKDAKDTANMLQKKLDTSFAETTRKISQKANDVVAKLIDEEKKLTQETEKIYIERSETFNTSAVKNSNEADHSEQKLADVCSLMAETNRYEVLDLKQKVLFNLKELTEKKPTIAPEHLSMFDYKEEEDSFGKLVLKDQTNIVPMPRGPLLNQSTTTKDNKLLKILKHSSVSVKKGQWVLKTELANKFSNANCVGVFSNNKIVAVDKGDNTLVTFFPLHRSERQFKVLFDNVHLDGLTVNRDNKLIALESPYVKVYGDDSCVTFIPGDGSNAKPVGIAVSKDNIIAVSFEDREEISLHELDGTFIKLLTAPGVGRYLTFYNNQVIYTTSSSSRALISIDCSTDTMVSEFGIGDDDSKYINPTDVCCDLDGSLYVSWKGYTVEIRHYYYNKSDGETLKYITVIKGCGSARNILITPGGELVVAAGNTVKIYHRVETDD